MRLGAGPLVGRRGSRCRRPFGLRGRDLRAIVLPGLYPYGGAAAVSILWGLLLNAVWLSFYMGKNFWAWTVAKAPLKLLLVPVYGYLIYLTLRGLQKSGLEKHL